MVPSRLNKKMLVKLEASVWVRFIAVRINLATQSLQNILLIFGRELIEAGRK